MQKIIPCLWFDDQAEEAANFYVETFSSLGGAAAQDTRIVSTTRYGESGAEASGRPKGTVMTVTFRIAGEEIVGLNGGPEFTFSEAVSLMAPCETQEEVDLLWEKLSQGGEQGPCGWLKDRYGLSWQVVPTILAEMLQDDDPDKRERVMSAMLDMKKLEIEPLRHAYDGS
jgi:predicted 3-demethylubiquinone-9 3-methyltransferase (glyoxalase superfamily)